jgi:hypothetical protein
MIEGDLFELKGKKRWKALRERVEFVLTNPYQWLVFILFFVLLFQFKLIDNIK